MNIKNKPNLNSRNEPNIDSWNFKLATVDARKNLTKKKVKKNNEYFIDSIFLSLGSLKKAITKTKKLLIKGMILKVGTMWSKGYLSISETIKVNANKKFSKLI